MNKIISPRFSKRTLGFALMGTSVIFLWLCWYAYGSYQAIKNLDKEALKIEELKGVIVHLDEVLTMSARMAVATGDLKWEERYLKFEPQLDAAIKESIVLSPEAYEGMAAQTDAANIKLVEMENQAFSFIHQSRVKEAQEILFGKEYEKQKHIYAQGMQQQTIQLRKHAEKILQAEKENIHVLIFIIVLVLFFLVAIWIIILNFINRWQKAMAQTHQKRSEQALQRSEELSHSIIETANDAFVSLDKEGKVIQWNKKAEDMFGWSKEEIIGEDLANTIIPRQHRDAHRNGLKHFMATGEGPVIGQTGELTALHRDGHEFLVEIKIWCSQVKKTYQYHAFLHDITLHKKKEKEMQRLNEELKESEGAARRMFLDVQKAHEELKEAQTQLLQSEKLASIGQLAAGVAHEINNPIGFVNSNIHTLEEYAMNYLKILSVVEDLKKALEEKNMEEVGVFVKEMEKVEKEINLDFMKEDTGALLEESKKGLERVKKIVLDLRTFAREDGEERVSIKVEDVIESIIGIINNEIKYKAELEKEYDELPLIKCHVQRLGQVFMNLIINAAHAIEDEGKITIRTFQKGQHACVEISDTGKGIPKDKLQKIFEPFYTTKPVGQGTGLGLSISYEIVKKHGGDIVVQSTLGQGTTFTVMLPLPEELKRV